MTSTTIEITKDKSFTIKTKGVTLSDLDPIHVVNGIVNTLLTQIANINNDNFKQMTIEINVADNIQKTFE